MLLNLAIEFAKSTGELIGRNLIITDENGIVIGSDDPSRLSTLHEASLEVIETGQAKSHDEVMAGRMIGVKPGITLPIELSGKVIGTLGIPGKPEEVTVLGGLVKRQLEIFLREKAYMQSLFLRERTLQSLIQEVAEFDFDKDNPFLLQRRVSELGFNLETPHLVMLVDLYHFGETTDKIKRQASGSMMEEAEIRIQSVKIQVLSTIKDVFSNPRDISMFLGEDKFIILNNLKSTIEERMALEGARRRCSELQESLDQQGIRVCIGMSDIARDISQLGQAFKDAQSALRIGKNLSKSPGLFWIGDFMTEDYLISTERKTRKRFLETNLAALEKHRDREDLFETIRCWCESGFRLTEATRCLKVHKNTLLYRLEKIRRITGIEPKDFRHFLPLYLAVVTSCIED